MTCRLVAAKPSIKSNAGIVWIRSLNVNLNSNIFIQENAFGDVVCDMATILFRPYWVNELMVETSREPWVPVNDIIINSMDTLLGYPEVTTYLLYNCQIVKGGGWFDMQNKHSTQSN